MQFTIASLQALIIAGVMLKAAGTPIAMGMDKGRIILACAIAAPECLLLVCRLDFRTWHQASRHGQRYDYSHIQAS
jgi:hypothetical protein